MLLTQQMRWTVDTHYCLHGPGTSGFIFYFFFVNFLSLFAAID